MVPTLDQVRDAVAQRRRGPPPETVRVAAVAAVLGPNLDLVLLKRADHPGDPWSGHVALPGGRMEPEDGSTLETAIRETREELGLDLAAAEYLGELDWIVTRPVHDLVVHPHVFVLDHRPSFVPNEEVASVHALSLQTLLAGQGRGPFQYTWRGHDLTLPRVEFDGNRLWGLTLQIVDDLLDRLDARGRGLARIAC